MKIEKLTENKIRIILKEEDLQDKNFDLQNLLLKTNENKNLFLEILEKAKEEYDFDTDGHKLLIETFSSDEEFFVFTITKYIEKVNTCTYNSHRKQRKIVAPSKKNSLFIFQTFDDFCNFCNFLCQNKSISFKNFSKNSSLYLYNNLYYLIITQPNMPQNFLSSSKEFGKVIRYTNAFESKLREYGKVIFKTNVINNCIKYFC